jgi:hypothetical protein
MNKVWGHTKNHARSSKGERCRDRNPPRLPAVGLIGRIRGVEGGEEEREREREREGDGREAAAAAAATAGGGDRRREGPATAPVCFSHEGRR